MTEQHPKRLLDQVRDTIRLKHYPIRTEEVYLKPVHSTLIPAAGVGGAKSGRR